MTPASELPDIDSYIAGLTENDSHNSANQALRGQINGIKQGGIDKCIGEIKHTAFLTRL